MAQMPDGAIRVSTTRGGAVFRVRARPGAPRTRVTGVHDGALKLDVAAPPEGGRANEEILRFLARELGVPPAACALTAGATARGKSIEISAINEAALSARLQRLVAAEKPT